MIQQLETNIKEFVRRNLFIILKKHVFTYHFKVRNNPKDVLHLSQVTQVIIVYFSESI